MNAHAIILDGREPAQVWLDVGAVAEVPIRGARRVQTVAGDVAVFRTGDDRIFALIDRCPHKGGPLSAGIVHAHAVACPLHNWSIALATGEPLGADAGKGCVPVVPVEVLEGRVRLALQGL